MLTVICSPEPTEERDMDLSATRGGSVTSMEESPPVSSASLSESRTEPEEFVGPDGGGGGDGVVKGCLAVEDGEG